MPKFKKKINKRESLFSNVNKVISLEKNKNLIVPAVITT